MTEKRPTPDQSAGKSRGKRAAPTIDLKATEVKAEDTAAGPARETPPVQEPPKSKPQPAESQNSESIGAPPMRGGSSHAGVAIAAGFAGALVMSLILAGLRFAGIVTPGDGDSNAQVAALEKQVQVLQNRPAPSSNNSDALQTRVAKMEDAIKNLPAGDSDLSERVSAADNALKALGLALTAFNRRSDDLAANTAQAQRRADAAEKGVSDLRAGLSDVSKTANAGASPAELQSLQQRIAALEQSAKTAQTQIEQATVSDKSARLALSAVALREGAARGAPFAEELTQAKSLGGDEKLLDALSPFAASGVPNDKKLAAELRALLPALQKAAGTSVPSGGFLKRLQANAEHLVRVRPVAAPPGDAAAAVLARLETDAAHDDINAALADLAKLPDKLRAPAQDWVAYAKSRQAALTAARQFAADTARALGSR